MDKSQLTNQSKQLIALLLLIGSMTLLNCSSSSKDSAASSSDESDLVLADESAPAAPSNSEATDMDMQMDDDATQAKVTETQPAPSTESSEVAEDDFAQFDSPSAPQGGEAPADTLSGTPEPVPEASLMQPDSVPPEPVAQNEPSVLTSDDPNVNQSFKSKNQNLQITDLQYKGNDAGGTLVIEGTGPMEYTVNKNQRLNQFIVDIPYAKLPKKLQRTFNTKDFQGGIGQIDAFESTENSARIVVQLRPGAVEPVVQREGSSLLLIAANYSDARNDSDKNAFNLRTGVDPGPAVLGSQDMGDGSQVSADVPLLDGTSGLREFLSNNNEFYGKKITLETSTMEVKDALRFIVEDIGVNMVISDKVSGPLSLKLRQVPWDQALSLILKVKSLGFIRQGNVLRIMTMEELKSEEEAAVNSDKVQKTLEPLQVKMFRVNYADAESVAKKLTQFSTEKRGKVEADKDTSSIVATDIAEVLARMEKIIKTLDTQPPQVLIEGRVVEASETFARSIGVSWGTSGQPVNISNGKQGPVSLNQRMSIMPGAGDAPGTLNMGMNIGVLDILGDLTASLALNENESEVKVLASPRIVTVTNKEAKISLDNQQSYIDTTPAPGGGVPFSQAKFISVPTNLTVTPQVTADSSVMMKVSLERTTMAPGTPPSPQRRTADTNVIVRNGQTMVLGGIFQNSDTVEENRVPFFGKLPVIGWLFKERKVNRNKTELLLFLTPKILTQADTEKSITL